MVRGRSAYQLFLCFIYRQGHDIVVSSLFSMISIRLSDSPVSNFFFSACSADALLRRDVFVADARRQNAIVAVREASSRLATIVRFLDR